MKLHICIFGLTLFLGLTSAQSQDCGDRPRLTKSVAGEIASSLKTLIEDTVDDNGVRILVPGIMRMSFHDCIDGCDGCINFDLKENNGLRGIVDKLETVYSTVNCKLSRADFWALASKVALDVGIEINNQRCGDDESCKTPKASIRFRYNRADCPTSPSHAEETDMPSALWDQPKILQFFKQKFRFNGNNAVAVMGMHTLGKAGTPFRMAWERNNTDGVSNNYYKLLLNANLCWSKEMAQPEVTGTGNPAYFWRTRDLDGFALNSDMALIKNFKADPVTGEPSCSYYDCGKSNTANMFGRYAKSSANWIKHINRLWSRVIEVNQTSLKMLRN